MRRNIDIDLEYQSFIDLPPMTSQEMYAQACSGDKVTVDTWKDIWVKNYQDAITKFGDFSEYSYGKLQGINRHRPMICLASGPSLKESFDELRANGEREYPVPVISTLHNYALLKDQGIKADYYLSLDAGDVVIEDMTEFGTKDPEWYWEQTKDDVLLAYVASPSKLWEKWKGKIYLFNCLLPDLELRKKMDDLQEFRAYISSGGNAGGAAMYTAKAIFGSSTIIFCGYDFCFGYNSQFHPTETKYDNYKGHGIGNTVRYPDVFGNLRHTWPSYVNFKVWTDFITVNIPGQWINCSEGILGAYREGNIRTMKYCSLRNALEQYRMSEVITVKNTGPQGVTHQQVKLKELFADPKTALPITMF